MALTNSVSVDGRRRHLALGIGDATVADHPLWREKGEGTDAHRGCGRWWQVSTCPATRNAGGLPPNPISALFQVSRRATVCGSVARGVCLAGWCPPNPP